MLFIYILVYLLFISILVTVGVLVSQASLVSLRPSCDATLISSVRVLFSLLPYVTLL